MVWDEMDPDVPILTFLGLAWIGQGIQPINFKLKIGQHGLVVLVDEYFFKNLDGEFLLIVVLARPYLCLLRFVDGLKFPKL